MSRTTADCPRRLRARAAFAAVALAAIAAAPVIALARATHPANTTITAPPQDVHYPYAPHGGGGGGGESRRPLPCRRRRVPRLHARTCIADSCAARRPAAAPARK